MDVTSIPAVTPAELTPAHTAAQPAAAEHTHAAVPEKQPNVKPQPNSHAPEEDRALSGEPVSPMSPEALDKTLEEINKSLASYDRRLQASMHEKVNRIMVKVYDTREKKVIREIPPEKIVDAFAKTLELAGILVDKKR